MAFEIIKRLFAIETAVHCLASRGAELRNKLCVVGMTMRTFNGFFAEHIGGAKLLFGIGRRNTERFEFLLSFFGHPV
ncbi:MAG: hypothetical protein EOO52_20310, partial [Gammaproteobacteria bacterium]